MNIGKMNFKTRLCEDNIIEDNEIIMIYSTMKELNDMIKISKSNNHSGSDGIMIELFKRLELENKFLLLSLRNN